ncbi:unnamed protein product [Hymenolepis diminuta]|uniref:Uncharacterized protein n=1 Tax=Hymenolepis diminuta TaxID=6216 RepID=A0A564Y5R3_HYMDI|nr:unnamed protein product [Hymenolepis diminuta]
MKNRMPMQLDKRSDKSMLLSCANTRIKQKISGCGHCLDYSGFQTLTIFIAGLAYLYDVSGLPLSKLIKCHYPSSINHQVHS